MIEVLASRIEFENVFRVTVDFWDKLDELLTVLEIPYVATKAMQRLGYGLADFYISWMRMSRSLARHIIGPTSLAQNLIDALKSREYLLVATPTMMVAIFLDPRIKYKLNNTEKECAVLALEKLHHRLKMLEKSQHANGATNSNDTLDELNQEAMVECAESDNTLNDGAIYTSGLHANIERYNSVHRADMKSEVMEFWKNRKNDYPILYSLACIVHSVHAGQCLVERNFSSFQYICDCRRLRLLPKNISDILMIRLNSKLYDEWHQEKIQEIRG